MVKIKVCIGSEVRRFDFPDNGKIFESLRKMARDHFKVDGVTVKYEDDEGDLITVTSEDDIREGAGLAISMGVILKVFLGTAQSSANQNSVVEESVSGDWVKFQLPKVAAEEEDMQEEKNEKSEEKEPIPDDAENMDVDPAGVPIDQPKEPEAQNEKILKTDWEALVEDFLGNPEIVKAMSNLAEAVLAGLKEGKVLSELVMGGLGLEPFRNHPFIQQGSPDMTNLLQKADRFGFIAIQAGQVGIEMALPAVLRGFARHQAGKNAIVDLAGVFKKIFPQWFAMLQQAVPNGQTADVDIGKLFMAAAGGQGNGPCGPFGNVPEGSAQAQAEPEVDPEVEAAAKEGIALHKGIICDQCNMGPIIGTRYKCKTRPNFDLCEPCFLNKNDAHEFEVIPVPVARSAAIQVVHQNVECDICKMAPIRGARYKCTVCPNFDMCEGCYGKQVHDQSHTVRKIAVPQRFGWGPPPQFRGWRRGGRGGGCGWGGRGGRRGRCGGGGWRKFWQQMQKNGAPAEWKKWRNQHQWWWASGQEGNQNNGEQQVGEQAEGWGNEDGHHGRHGRRGRGKCGRGGRGRHGRGGRWRCGLMDGGNPNNRWKEEAAVQQNAAQHEGEDETFGEFETIDGLDMLLSDSSSSSSSSSEDEDEGQVQVRDEGKGKKGGKGKGKKMGKKERSKRKKKAMMSKKKRKKLAKQVKKRQQRVQKLRKARNALERKLNQAVRKLEGSRRQLRKAREQENNAREAMEQDKKKEQEVELQDQKKKDAYTLWRESESKAAPAAPVAPEAPGPVLLAPPAEEKQSVGSENVSASDGNAYPYADQLRLLKEMGFPDVEQTRRVLEQNKGNLKDTVVVLALARE